MLIQLKTFAKFFWIASYPSVAYSIVLSDKKVQLFRPQLNIVAAKTNFFLSVEKKQGKT